MPQSNNLITRSSAPLKSFNEENLSLEAIATTEAPATVFSWTRYDFISEILLMDGVILPASKQIPLLDSHSRGSVKNVLGSVSNFDFGEVKKNRSLECLVRFAETNDGRETALKFKDGHLTDFSVGYKNLEEIWVEAGQTKTIQGKEYQGPVSVVTKWELKELSATPIGADIFAKAKSEASNNLNKGENNMPEPIKKEEVKKEEKKDTPQETKTLSQAEVKKISDEAIKQERKRVSRIRQDVGYAGLDSSFADELIEKGSSVEESRSAIFARLEEKSTPVGTIEMGEDAKDKFRKAVTDGLLFRSGVTLEKPSPGFEDFRGRSLIRIAEECIVKTGENAKGLSNLEIAGRALGMSARGVASSVSDFPIILSNLAEKRMLKSYTEASTTYEAWCSIVDGSDFKPINGIDMGAIPELELINENGEYKNVTIDETKESYVIKTFGNTFNLSRKMIINDDLKAFARIPMLFGAASKRTVNNHVYALLSANPSMGDGKALFEKTRGNLATGDAVGGIKHETLSASKKQMRNLKDISGKVNLNIAPKFLLIGSDYETDADIILRSTSLPVEGMASGVKNIWENKLTPIIDSTLDMYDAKAWYLLPDKNAADTIEVAFLDGKQNPFLESDVDFKTDGLVLKCRLDFGVGVMGSRMIKNPGK